jgi:rare lipoprotein A
MMMKNTTNLTLLESRFSLLFCSLALVLLSACSWVPKGEIQLDVGLKDRGVASWYGGQFHGKQAANGELFDMEALTAAHRTLPLGSVVRVVNFANGKHVHVRINDRGPYVNGRILDLSHAAAARLGMVNGGLAVVQVEIVGDRRPDLLLPSDDQQEVSVRLLLQSMGSEFGSSQSGHFDPSSSSVAQTVRLLPGDMLLQRRQRRVSTILSVDYTAHTNIVVLTLV